MKFFGKRQKPITKMTARELRACELKSEGRRKQLERKAVALAKRKESVFEQGAKATPMLRRSLAQQFDALTTEEVLVGKRLAMAAQEAVVIGQLRAAKEQGGRESVIRATDFPQLAKIMGKSTAELDEYDRLLSEGLDDMRVEMTEGSLGEAGADVLRAWEQMDSGALEPSEALKQADHDTRARVSSMPAD